jgi:ankyrin repeat protein
MQQLSLYRASFYGDNSKVMRLLSETNTPVDAGNDMGETALHCSCSGDHPKTTLLLLEGGANPNGMSWTISGII